MAELSVLEAISRACAKSKDYTDGKAEALQNNIRKVEKQVKNINTNLDQSYFITNGETSCSKEIPENVCPYAQVTEISGISVKSRNLITYPYTSTSHENKEGNTIFTINTDCSITLQNINVSNVGSSKEAIFIVCTKLNADLVANQTYFMTPTNPNDTRVEYFIEAINEEGKIVEKSSDTGLIKWEENLTFQRMCIRKIAGKNCSNLTSFPYLYKVENGESHNYTLPGNILNNSKVKQIRITGKNLWGGERLARDLSVGTNYKLDTEQKTVSFKPDLSGNKVIFKDQIFKPNTAYTLVLYGRTTDTVNSNIKILYTDASTSSTVDLGYEDGYAFLRTSSQKTVAAISILYSGGTTTLYYEKCGLFEGELNLEKLGEFEPYREQIIEIPEWMQDFEDYGYGIPGTDYQNKIDFENRQYIQKVRTLVVDGSSRWETYVSGNDDTGYVYCLLEEKETDARPGYSTSICSHFENAGRAIWGQNSGGIGQYTDHPGMADYQNVYRNLYFRTTIDTLKGWKDYIQAQKDGGNPVTFVYKLKEPIVTKFPADKELDEFFSTNGNYYIQIVGDNGYPVPSLITYIKKEA